MNCFSTVKGAKDFKDHFMNISIYIALVPLSRHSNKEKNQEDLENGIMQALKIANQNNFLTIMLQTMKIKLYVLLSVISDK